MGTGTGQGGYNVSVRAVFPFLSPAGVKKHLPDFLRDVRPGTASLFCCVLMNGGVCGVRCSIPLVYKGNRFFVIRQP